MGEQIPQETDPAQERLQRIIRLERTVKSAIMISFIGILLYPTAVIFFRKFSWIDGDWLICILGFPFLLMLPLVLGGILGKIVHGAVYSIFFRRALREAASSPLRDDDLPP
jgi:hypothetical protein